MVKNTPYPLATKRINDDASTNRCLPLHGALWMQPWEWSPIQCCYRTISRAPWTYLLSSYAAIDGDQPIDQILLYLPRYGCFPCLPGHAHDERVSCLQSDFYVRITIRFDTRFDTSDLGLINCVNTVHVGTIWTIGTTATTTIKRYNKKRVSISQYKLSYHKAECTVSGGAHTPIMGH